MINKIDQEKLEKIQKLQKYEQDEVFESLNSFYKPNHPISSEQQIDLTLVDPPRQCCAFRK